jgi:hypothetical protein
MLDIQVQSEPLIRISSHIKKNNDLQVNEIKLHETMDKS